jgi:hypothetical protein
LGNLAFFEGPKEGGGVRFAFSEDIRLNYILQKRLFVHPDIPCGTDRKKPRKRSASDGIRPKTTSGRVGSHRQAGAAWHLCGIRIFLFF